MTSVQVNAMLPNTRSSLRSFPVRNTPDVEITGLQQRLDSLREQLYLALRTVNQASHEAHRKALAARIQDLEADIAALTAKRAMRWRKAS
jgi:hypothetical protein